MISIALATYNGEKYLREQIDSILRQSYVNFEVVACDDCSTDNTWTILMEYSNLDKRIKCYKNDKNIGYGSNFEKAMKICKGEYIAFCDQDDIWLEDHLSVLIENIGNNIASCADAFIYKNDFYSETLGELNLTDSLDTFEKKIKRIVYGGSPYQGASMLVNSIYINDLLPLPEGAKIHDAWIALYACVLNKFVYVNIPVTLYRQHDKNVTDTSMKRSALRFFRNFKLIKNRTFEPIRAVFCAELLLRLPEMDLKYKEDLSSALQWFVNIKNHIYRFRHIDFWIKIYPFSFSGSSKKYLPLLLIRYLFL